MKAGQFITTTLFLLIGCTASDPSEKSTTGALTENKDIPDLFPKNVYFINAGGCVYKDSILIDSISNPLYKDKDGNIYFKTYDQSHKGYNPVPVLISRFYNGCEGDSTYDLRKNIDPISFHFLGGCYFADKNKIIIHNFMIDGGNLGMIEGANISSFSVFPNSMYAYDKNRIYYKGMTLEKADPRSFNVIYQYRSEDTVGWFGKDNINYFNGSDICEKKEVEEYLKNSK